MKWGVRVNVGRRSKPVYQKSGEFRINNKSKISPEQKKALGKQFARDFLLSLGGMAIASLALAKYRKGRG